ncbi:MAG: DUF3486 family protein [Holophagales bacterium]|nr:DUF3486 family protein [Holophagales bacterium]MYB20833.1 DUF3486 family protein [Holophagales bacterium]MYD23457.1 DUF3486 family protein [Holophagales bacterium]MYH25472.1 DUF3486 family protein [Holophagales bacterium]MYI34476.1 DUF3486 family protein [Holophagales bacterium]
MADPGWGEGRRTRGRMSRIDRLEPELKRELDGLLRSGVPQTEIIERLRAPLAAAGEAPLSKAGLNRYSTRMEAVGARVKETRAIAEAWVARLGDEPTGEVGQLAIEVLRSIAFDYAINVAERSGGDDPDAPPALDAKGIGELALAIQRIERAGEIGRKTEAMLQGAREVVDEGQKEGGISDEFADFLRERLKA